MEEIYISGCSFFTNISVTLENSYIGAGQATRGAGVLVTIDKDLAINVKDSCGQHTVLLQMQHKLMHFSNVTFQGIMQFWSRLSDGRQNHSRSLVCQPDGFNSKV